MRTMSVWYLAVFQTCSMTTINLPEFWGLASELEGLFGPLLSSNLGKLRSKIRNDLFLGT